MGKAPAQEKKRKRIKGTSYTSSTGLKNTPSQSAHHARTLHTKKLKKTDDGGFTVASSRGLSGVSVPNVSINDPRSTEEILESWISPSESFGWDEDYINSFIENDLRPPDQDPEQPTTANKPAIKGVCSDSLVCHARF